MLPVMLGPALLVAQTPPQLPPGGLIQLQVAQPAVDISSPPTATAAFDPAVVRAGEKVFYRVTVEATESSIEWPEGIAAPAELKLGPGLHGQITQMQGNKFRPVTVFAYELPAPAPGHFSISNFVVDVYGRPLEIPATGLEVVPENAAPLPPARELELEVSATNVFLGQPVRVRVSLPAGPRNEIEALREVQFNGSGLLTDKTAVRQSVETVNYHGQLKPAMVYETIVTPIATGPIRFSAQAFTAGRDFSGPISLTGQVTIAGGPPKYVFLVSEPVEFNVRPLPAAEELPGFTGALGKFLADPPQLSTNCIHVGEPVRLQIAFHGEGNLTRFIPPDPPRSRAWQIIADKPPAAGFTLIPLTDDVQTTPAIPFCAFDPVSGNYLDLTIPALPVTVVGESLPTQMPVTEEAGQDAAPARLSGLAPVQGRVNSSLKPLQLRGWFVGVQLLPVIGFLVLWQWDRRRRFLEAHPEIVRRRQAKRALRREKIKLRAAVSAGDAAAFGRHAVAAMTIAAAPHFPAHPRALVCGDVLERLEAAEQNGVTGETVRKLFEAADNRFARSPQTRADLIALQAAVEAVLQKLEEKL